jgi:hypothetical protein
MEEVLGWKCQAFSMETDLRRAPSVVDKPLDRRSVGIAESQQNQAERSMTDGLSWAEKEEETVIPSVFDRSSIQEIGTFQLLVLRKAYP